MVWYAGPIFQCGFGRANVHVPVDLPTVGIYYFAAKVLGYGDCQLGLARSGGPNYVEDAGPF